MLEILKNANANVDRKMLRKLLVDESDLNVMRIHYCYQIGSTFIAISNLESTITSLMLMCDKIKVATVLGDDTETWRKLLEKQSNLQSSTLGSLISILAKHGIQTSNLEYLKWVKNKRDFFIHRLFHNGAWPGDLDERGADIMYRRLLYLEVIFGRASNRISKILEDAGLLAIIDFGESGSLLVNTEFFTENTSCDL
ncbi:hypothetical protein ACFWXH_22140 [Mesorhizobium sp. NPDC059054]|uniref:hypothetical protein n=1 Tax=Mesorhizobium sp. NPDC059054 TaxID=3346711 RepID=UPI0036C813EC